MSTYTFLFFLILCKTFADTSERTLTDDRMYFAYKGIDAYEQFGMFVEHASKRLEMYINAYRRDYKI